jgi:hypothetical protein
MSTIDPAVNPDYRGLKAAAIKMAHAPECVQRAVIKAYPRQYGSPKLSGLYLLLRVLFVLPSDDRTSGGVFSPWSRPVVMKAKQTGTWNYQWPVLVNPQTRVIHIERCENKVGGYAAIEEYQWFKSTLRFPTRTPAEIEALEIKAADPHPSSR